MRLVAAFTVQVTMRANSSVPAISQLSQIDYAIKITSCFYDDSCAVFFAFVRRHLVAFAFFSVWHVS